MSDELKPCPFCGDKASHKLIEAYSLDSSYFVISCEACPAVMYANDELTSQDIESWNTRSDAAKDAEIKALNALVSALSEELAATYEELIDHTGDDLNDTRARRFAALKGDAA